MKKCPFCAEEIQEEAVKCRHCGEWLTGKPLQHHLIAFKDYLQPFYDEVVALFKDKYNNLSQKIEAYKNKKPKSLYAGFWKRFCAVIIDAVILSLMLAIPFAFIVDTLRYLKMPQNEINVIRYLLLSIVALLYYSFMESSLKQGTLGKLLLGVKVTSIEGTRISFGSALWRNIGKAFSVLTIGIGYAMAGYTKKKQAFHDMIANCFVVNKAVANQLNNETNEQIIIHQLEVETARKDSGPRITEESKPFKTEIPPAKVSKTGRPLNYVIGALGIGILLALFIWPLFESQGRPLPQVPEIDYDRFVKGQLPVTPPMSGKKFDPSTLSPEARKLYEDRKSAMQVSKLEPAPPPRKKTAWPASAKVAWIDRCVSSLVSQGVSEQHARSYASCIANGLEKEFGMEEYDQMMKARPNPKGSEYDRRLNKVFESCGNLPRPQ